MREDREFQILSPELNGSIELPFSDVGVSAGFPSMVEGSSELKLDLNQELIKNPASTFFARVSGVSMVDDGVDDGDLMVIDKSVEPYDGCLAVCFVDGEFTLKRFYRKGDYGVLMPANENYSPITVTSENDFMIWGVVKYLIKAM